ncbi:hypothetical protein RCJ22_26790 [Vibrio sp. FNV 38]|nr:hypothetical protein [Vibrio sp. FNV 38]
MSEKCVYCGKTKTESCWKAKSVSDFTDDGEITLCSVCQGEKDMCCAHCQAESKSVGEVEKVC